MTVSRNGHEALGRISESPIEPLKYYELVANINVLLQQELGNKLSKMRDKIDVAFALATPGSDGRLEAGSVASPYEAIILTNENVDLELLESAVKGIVEKSAPGRIVSFETKGPNTSLVNYHGDPHKPQAARVAVGRLLAGDRQILEDAKARLGKEIIAMPAKQVDRIAGFRRDAARATKEGKNKIHGNDVIHFDLETGTVFFDPQGNQRSFKIGPLRLVQNTLLVEEVRHTRKEKQPDFIRSLHSGIVNRLTQLSDDKLISFGRDIVHELQEHYAFFLKLYHRSEQTYIREHQVAMQLTPSEIDEVAKRLAGLQEITDELKIEAKRAAPNKKTA